MIPLNSPENVSVQPRLRIEWPAIQVSCAVIKASPRWNSSWDSTRQTRMVGYPGVENHWSKLSCGTVLWVIYFQFLKSQDSSVLCFHSDTYPITFRQLMLTSVTASAVFLFRFVWLRTSWYTKMRIANGKGNGLNHYSRSARINRAAASLPECSIKHLLFQMQFQWAFCSLFSFSELTVHSDILFIAYLCQLPLVWAMFLLLSGGDKKYFS